MSVKNPAKVEQGRRNNRAGKAARARVIKWLRANGYPNADVTASPHRNDISAIGDLGIEVTVEPWEDISAKLDQARDDSIERGGVPYCVTKPRKGIGDIGEAYALTTVRQWTAAHQELAALRAEIEILRKTITIRAPRPRRASA